MRQVLCAIKVYTSGNIDMTPGFSPKPNIKVDVMKGNSYKLASEQGPVSALSSFDLDHDAAPACPLAYTPYEEFPPLIGLSLLLLET